MKKFVGLLFTLSLFFSGIGSAFANESKLDSAVNEVLGTPYKWGGTTDKGFDCSGFIRYIFEQFDTKVTRTSLSQSKEGEFVEKKDLRVGDLVFFNTNGVNISHAGIYVGNGQFAHSSSSKGVTVSKLSDTYYEKRYVTARRLIEERNYKDMIKDIHKQSEVT